MKRLEIKANNIRLSKKHYLVGVNEDGCITAEIDGTESYCNRCIKKKVKKLNKELRKGKRRFCEVHCCSSTEFCKISYSIEHMAEEYDFCSCESCGAEIDVNVLFTFTQEIERWLFSSDINIDEISEKDAYRLYTCLTSEDAYEQYPEQIDKLRLRIERILNKPKKQVITVSKQFLSGHPKAGQLTYFREKIIVKLGEYYPVQCNKCGWIGSSEECNSYPLGDTGDYSHPSCPICESDVLDFKCEPKIHTIRGNYPFWHKAFHRNTMLSVRQWSGKPYRTSQQTILNIESGKWGIQFISLINGHNGLEAFVVDKKIDIDVLAANDGLSRDDFEAWFAPHFKRRDIFTGVVIHFTDFRY